MGPVLLRFSILRIVVSILLSVLHLLDHHLFEKQAFLLLIGSLEGILTDMVHSLDHVVNGSDHEFGCHLLEEEGSC